MFFNFSNHKSNTWSQKQLNAAKKFASEIVDVDIPIIDPMASEFSVKVIAQELVEYCNVTRNDVCHVVGEPSLSYEITRECLLRGANVVVATTDRKVVQSLGQRGELIKTSTFEFCKFREIGRL